MGSVESFPQSAPTTPRGESGNSASIGTEHIHISSQNIYFDPRHHPETLENALDRQEAAKDLGAEALEETVEIKSSATDDSGSDETPDPKEPTEVEPNPPDTEVGDGNGGDKPPNPPDGTPEAPKDPEEDEPAFTEGQPVNVHRSNGRVERGMDPLTRLGWFAGETEEIDGVPHVVVRRWDGLDDEGEDVFLVKYVPVDQLKEWQKETNDTVGDEPDAPNGADNTPGPEDTPAPEDEAGGVGEDPPDAPEIEPISPELGYSDPVLQARAAELHISSEAITAGKELCYPLGLLIRAMESDHDLLYKDLCEQGIPLPAAGTTEGPLSTQTRDEKRKTARKPAPSASPYPVRITKSEVRYFLEKLQEKPAWLRNSLIRPGSLPVPTGLYHKPVPRFFLDIANRAYCPIGQRILASKLAKNERSRIPDEDYGVFGYGKEKRLEALERVHAVDKTVKRSRYLLSFWRRHANKGEIRKLARIDLAAEIAGVRRDLLAFEESEFSLSDLPRYQEPSN